MTFYRSFLEKVKRKGWQYDSLAQLYFTHNTKNCFGIPNKCQIRRIYTSMTPGKAGGYEVQDGSQSLEGGDTNYVKYRTLRGSR